MRQLHLLDGPPQKSSWLKAPFLVGRRVLTERRLHRRGLKFRASDPSMSAHAYNTMNAREFANINACQEWANWRTIPRLLRLVDAKLPWFVVDLGCGQGLSTEVLARFSPAASRILGFDLSHSALEMARHRKYTHASGKRHTIDFRVQSVCETWLNCDDHALPHGSVTIVNASGIVGHHLNYIQATSLAREIRRVLIPGGWAFLDVGPRIRRSELKRIMAASGFLFLGHARSCWLDPYGQSAFQLISGG